MIISELIKSMSAAGAPIEAILIAVEALEASAATLTAARGDVERQRALARDRKRRSRESRSGIVDIPIVTEVELAQGGCDQSVTVTPMSRDSHVTKDGLSRDSQDYPPSLPPLLSPQTPQTTPPAHPPATFAGTHEGAREVDPENGAEKRPETKRLGRTRLPIGWQPKPLSQPMLVLVAKWDGEFLENLLTEFRAYWHDLAGTAALKSDWDKVWANRLRQVSVNGGTKNGKHTGSGEAGSWLTACADGMGQGSGENGDGLEGRRQLTNTGL